MDDDRQGGGKQYGYVKSKDQRGGEREREKDGEELFSSVGCHGYQVPLK